MTGEEADKELERVSDKLSQAAMGENCLTVMGACLKLSMRVVDSIEVPIVAISYGELMQKLGRELVEKVKARIN